MVRYNNLIKSIINSKNFRLYDNNEYIIKFVFNKKSRLLECKAIKKSNNEVNYIDRIFLTK